MLDYRILGSGRVTYDSWNIDPSVPLAHQTENLTEDLLQVEYESCVILDVGWHPELSPDGQFGVKVVLDYDWMEPWFARSTDYDQLIGLISTGVSVAEWLGRVDDRLSLRLAIDNTPGALSPTRGAVLHALLAMDGQERTLACLGAPDGTALMIGGGNDGRYLVNFLAATETQESYVLTDPTAVGTTVELCCGGQTAEYPAHWCVDFRLVLDAAHYFINDGGMAPERTWQ
ncbi:MAG TPA: Imm1 family immunity protein [Symbiobacteriaceae bacterium]|nr:Imm1 family immunity protein [Symbiobacteriaceae bacterium]